MPRSFAVLLSLGALAPAAQAQTLGDLTCATRQLPSDLRVDLRSRYREGGLATVFDSPFFTRPDVVEKVVANCVDVSKPGHEARSAALGRALASYEVANAAGLVLRSRHKLETGALDGAWAMLSAKHRQTFAAFARAAREVPQDSLIDAVGAFLALLRPASDPAATAADKALVADAIAYAAMRAQLETIVGPTTPSPAGRPEPRG
ncbi:MAG TPA: hypothetical protein VFR28_08360, partial [Allosphingosinicella sp.]|nr:hypothetical protein [Allosphingosinicella sp.]